MVFIGTEEPLAVAAVAAIHTGDLATLQRLLAQNPTLATARLGTDGMSRTLLHIVTDWPGHYPNGATTVARLIAPARMSTPGSMVHTPRPRCTGRPVATTSTCLTLCSTLVPTSRRPAR